MNILLEYFDTVSLYLGRFLLALIICLFIFIFYIVIGLLYNYLFKTPRCPYCKSVYYSLGKIFVGNNAGGYRCANKKCGKHYWYVFKNRWWGKSYKEDPIGFVERQTKRGVFSSVEK